MRGEGLEDVARVLAVEGGRDVPRSQVAVGFEGDALVLRVEARDTSALRAALNSYLRWAALALEVREVSRR
jgi:KEOPS complex subunit Pcc1